MILFFTVIEILLTAGTVAQTIIKVGILIPKDDAVLQRDVGMYNSLGAIPIAIDRIVEENLLNNFNFSFKIYNDECLENLAAGYAAKLFEEDDVDVIFGSTCNAPALIVGSLGKFYNKPVMTWGLVNVNDLTGIDKYPTVITIGGTSLMIGQSVIQVLRQFEWKQFAFLYATNDARNRCSYIKNDVESVVNDDDEIFISFQRSIDNTSLENVKRVLTLVKSRARIMVACYEGDYDRRQHLLALKDLQMNTDEYVNIFVELRGLGFGSRYTSGADTSATVTGTVPFWILGPTYTPDGRDADAKLGARTSFMLDFQSTSSTDLKPFAAAVMERAQSWPFYCQNCSADLYNVSTYAKYLHDSFYLYARALNQTFTGLNDTQALRRGSDITSNSRGTFKGMTGIVNINSNGTRDSTVWFTGLQANFTTKVFMTIPFTEGVPIAYVNFTDPATTIWAIRNGKAPLAIPLCGFDGNSCPVNFWESYAAYAFSALALGIILITIIIVYALYYRREQMKKLNQLWQISFVELDRPQKTKSGFTSQRSLQSKNSTSTKMTVESMADSKNYSYFYLRQEPVAAKKIHIKVPLTQSDHEEFRKLTQMDSDNCNRFIGFCINGPEYYAVWKYCTRGSLKDVIAKGSYNMDAFFVLSIMRDIINGLSFIHSQSFLGFHGRLSSRNCVVDDRWVVKLSDYGCNRLQNQEKKRKTTYLWIAPELMRMTFSNGTKAGDIYSFAIICSEVLTRKSPWDYENRPHGLDELLYLIKKGGPAPMRPNLNNVDIPDLNTAVLHLIQDCWQENPENRPTIGQVKSLVKSMSGRNLNLMDHIFGMMEQYAENLTEEVAERTKELVEEKKKSDVLLYRMLPKQVADSLKAGRSVEPENFDNVTVFFSDVVQFTVLASKCTPLQVVNLLNDLYSLFDSYIETHDVYKVETIGDGYMCVSGLPHRNGSEHGREISNLSLALMNAVKSFRIAHLPQERVNIRIGAHTGPCTAGVVGLTMPRYCLFGDTVNTASRMESNGKPGHVHISADLNRLLLILGGFVTESRGEVIIKGKGVMETFWLISKVEVPSPTAIHQSPELFNSRAETETMYNQFITSN